MNTAFENEAIVLRIEGELSLEHIAEFKTRVKEEIQRSAATTVIFDLGELSYVDSAGIGSLFFIKNMVDKMDGEMQVKAVSPRVREIMKSCGMLSVFNIT